MVKRNIKKNKRGGSTHGITANENAQRASERLWRKIQNEEELKRSRARKMRKLKNLADSSMKTVKSEQQNIKRKLWSNVLSSIEKNNKFINGLREPSRYSPFKKRRQYTHHKYKENRDKIIERAKKIKSSGGSKKRKTKKRTTKKKTYKNIPGYGKRLVRSSKTGKKYVLAGGKKIRL